MKLGELGRRCRQGETVGWGVEIFTEKNQTLCTILYWQVIIAMCQTKKSSMEYWWKRYCLLRLGRRIKGSFGTDLSGVGG